MATISTEGFPILPIVKSLSFPVSTTGHLILIFKDDDGNEFTIHSGPTNQEPPRGELDMRHVNEPLLERYNEINKAYTVTPEFRGNTLVDLGGRDAAAMWDILIRHSQNIQDAPVMYDPFTANCNSSVAWLLDVIGIDLKPFLPDPAGIMLLGYVGINTRFEYDYALHGTAENDILRGRGGSQTFYGLDGNDRLLGGAGSDILKGGRGNDTLLGQNGNDRLYGKADDDTLDGGAGRDRLYGGTGNDTLDGGDGNDKLGGGADDDLLFGSTGDDRLNGGTGNDVLEGGAGRDRLLGGAGEDTFVFKSASESRLGDASDYIVDFTPGQDKIDIQSVVSGLAFGADDFTGSGPSFYVDELDGDSEVLVDINGNAKADMRILALDVTGLGADDFVF